MGARLSVVIPTLNRPRELSLCLEGFARQTAPPDDFEIIVVDNGSTVDLAPVTEAAGVEVVFVRRPHAGISAARNAGIARASAPLLALYDDDLRPAPDFVEYCLRFHDGHPADEDSALLYFSAEDSVGAEPVMRWGFDRMYPFPSAGVWRWPCFWGGTVTCKRALFRDGGFNPEYLAAEDAEFAVRAAMSTGLRVHFDPALTGTMTRLPTFRQILRRQYFASYFGWRLQRDHPAQVRFSSPLHERPEEHALADRVRLRALLAAAGTLETGPAARTDRGFELLSAMWTKAEVHARATGWMDARDGRAPRFEEIV